MLIYLGISFVIKMLLFSDRSDGGGGTVIVEGGDGANQNQGTTTYIGLKMALT